LSSDARAVTVSAAFSPVPLRQLSSTIGFTSCRSALYTAIVKILRLRAKLILFLQSTLAIVLMFSLCALTIHALDAAQKPAEKPAEKKAEKAASAEKVENPAQIELLETRYRFEMNGDSRKEVHARVKINSELGVRQFARLNFDYNRSFESVEIPLVRITHASGGTADILPSAITDNPNPAVVDAPAYQDVRVKSVRILGLEPGDRLEYRVITTTAHHPLAPDFWLDHTFDRTGVVSQEIFELDLPASRLVDSVMSRRVEIRINPATPATVRQETGTDGSSRSIYHWQQSTPKPEKGNRENDRDSVRPADIALSSFPVWGVLSQRLAEVIQKPAEPSSTLSDKAISLTKTITDLREKLEALYSFVSRDIITIDLPLDATGFRTRTPTEILSSGYATPMDKFVILSALASTQNLPLEAALVGTDENVPSQLPRTSLFVRVLTNMGPLVWCDPSLEVAPFGLLSPGLRGKKAFRVFNPPASNPLADIAYAFWFPIPVELPFPSIQKVNVDAALAADGKLTTKVHYAMRGDNELVLRVAFHKTPKEKWNELAQLLSITDGFRGQVTSVNASDPYATREPFTLDYEITMPKFVDWSKKPVRIPALLPQLGLPDPPAKPVAGAATSPIELGTPLEVETRMTLRLPPGTTAQTPTGTTVQRDYATYASQYSAKGPSTTASRHINFLLREIPANRAVDYNSFLRAVQSDEAQDFTLVREEGTTPEKKPSAPKSPTPTQAAAAQPKP
jgi:hypothetical protein